MKTLDTEKIIINYTNHFEFNNRIFAYRKKILFDITETPKALFCYNNNGCLGYWINRKWISESTIKTIVKNEPKQIDISNLQWYQQINLDKVFNL